MPVSFEQWKAAVGTWNRSLSLCTNKSIGTNVNLNVSSHVFRWNRGCSRTKKKRWSLSILPLVLFLLYICMGDMETGSYNLGGLVHGCNVGGGASPFPCLFAFRWDHISLVARRLLIISGDIEVNPGPGETTILFPNSDFCPPV